MASHGWWKAVPPDGVYCLNDLMMLSAMCLLLSYMKKQFKGMKYLRLGEVAWLKYFYQITLTGKKWNNIFLLLQNKSQKRNGSSTLCPLCWECCRSGGQDS